MYQSRSKTPEPSPILDFDQELDTSCPLKPLKLPVSGHNAEALAPGHARDVSATHVGITR